MLSTHAHPAKMFRLCILAVLSFVAGSPSDCELKVTLEQNLLNEGFHRNLTYRLQFYRNWNSDFLDNCTVCLNQLLPNAIYANPDELEDLRRTQKLSAIPRNRVNIELPAEQSQPTNVYIFGKLTDDDQANLWIPVHARYHRSKPGGGYIESSIAPPILYISCPGGKLEKCEKKATTMTFLCNTSSKEKCFWRHVDFTILTKRLWLAVPVGNTNAFMFVTTGTACVVISCSYYLLRALYEYIIKNRQ